MPGARSTGGMRNPCSIKVQTEGPHHLVRRECVSYFTVYCIFRHSMDEKQKSLGWTANFVGCGVGHQSRIIGAQKSGGQSHPRSQHLPTKCRPERLQKTVHVAGAALQG